MPTDYERAVQAAFDGDTDLFDALVRCQCCCAEHTWGAGCPAYAWGTCRGQNTILPYDEKAWEEHYAKHFGMSREKFYNTPSQET